MLRSGYILNSRADWVWFLGLPYVAIAFAMACHSWLPMMALASVGLWISIPHHLATWLRTYALREDWERWKPALVIGPLVVLGTTALGMSLAPKTLLFVSLLWDHQHSLMQQHGLARIYDFKACAGGPHTGRFDLALHWFLYGNMLITSPLFFRLWGPELYLWQVPLAPQVLLWIQYLSWGALGTYLFIYFIYTALAVRAGEVLNPVKYLFLFSSYFLWYYTSWHTDSLLVFGIAHRLMHGVQYIVIVNSYLGRKLEPDLAPAATADGPPQSRTLLPSRLERLLASHTAWAFLALGFVYVLFYQFLVLRPLDELGFGVLNFMAVGPQPRPGMSDMSRASSYDLFAATLIQAIPMTHYFIDSFIWKVSDRKVQQGL